MYADADPPAGHIAPHSDANGIQRVMRTFTRPLPRQRACPTEGEAADRIRDERHDVQGASRQLQQPRLPDRKIGGIGTAGNLLLRRDRP